MKIKSAGPAETGAGSGICVGAGGITGISMEEKGGSVEEEGVGAFDGAKSYCWIIKISTVLLNVSQINGRTQALQGSRVRLNSPCLT